ncbi:MAG: NADP-dependent isocitrate dehydrogenase [Promethearchaeota archaeon]
MIKFDKLELPKEGERIKLENDELLVPNAPIIPFVEGDGIGPEVINVARNVLDAGVKNVYSGDRQINWLEIYAGGKAEEKYGVILPDDTIKAIAHFLISLKGPVRTPVSGGYRSVNVQLRQRLDLYANIRPIFHIEGVPTPIVHPETVDLVIFRENTEDLYGGLEWPAGSEPSKQIVNFLFQQLNVETRKDAGLGLKVISEYGTKRIMRKAIQYALIHDRKRITLVHKGNIMKFTEGAFCEWGYKVAKEEFGNIIITEKELEEEYYGTLPAGKVLMNDRITDAMFQELLLRPRNYDILVAPNLTGDYMSDAAAALIGGLGVAPGVNMGDHIAVFEAIHGTAPDIAGKNIANPSSAILSGMMMLEYLGWQEAANIVFRAVRKTIQSGKVTADLARLLKGISPVSTTEFADHVIANMK